MSGQDPTDLGAFTVFEFRTARSPRIWESLVSYDSDPAGAVAWLLERYGADHLLAIRTEDGNELWRAGESVASASLQGPAAGLAAFLSCQTQPSAGAQAAAADLFAAYQQWCRSTGARLLSRDAFGRALTQRGVRRGIRAGQRCYVGIALLRED